MDFIRVSHAYPDSIKLDALMRRQFPPEEYMPLTKQLELQATGDIEIWALYDEIELIGFTTIRLKADMAYLFFLAFDDAYQGKGYGSEAVRKIAEIYSDKVFTVDFELVNDDAENNEQRIRRRNFYLRNGFTETGWGLSYLGVDYEIFCMNGSFSVESFQSMLDGLPIESFHPRYFQL